MSGKMAGVDKIRPLERAAGMDARKLRREYGRDLILMGNVDKRALAEGREAIDKEVEMVKEAHSYKRLFCERRPFYPSGCIL